MSIMNNRVSLLLQFFSVLIPSQVLPAISLSKF